MKRFASAVVVAALVTLAAPAHARLGNSAYLVATSCTGCHTGGGDRPLVEVTQTTPDPLAPGGTALFHVTMTSTNAGGVGRFASFAASVPRSAGSFKDGDETDTCELTGGCPSNRTAIRDITGRAFEAGVYEWDLELENLGSGTFTLEVGCNDNNDNGRSSGDRNGEGLLTFTVAEGEGEGEGEGELPGEGEGEVPGEGEGEGEGAGCCTSSPSQAPLAFTGLLLLRRRRR